MNERDFILQRARTLVGKPVEWTSERTSLGDFDGRDWTLEVFDVPPSEIRSVQKQLWTFREHILDKLHKSIQVLYHSPDATTRYYPWVREGPRAAAVESVDQPSMGTGVGYCLACHWHASLAASEAGFRCGHCGNVQATDGEWVAALEVSEGR